MKMKVLRPSPGPFLEASPYRARASRGNPLPEEPLHKGGIWDQTTSDRLLSKKNQKGKHSPLLIEEGWTRPQANSAEGILSSERTGWSLTSGGLLTTPS